MEKDTTKVLKTLLTFDDVVVTTIDRNLSIDEVVKNGKYKVEKMDKERISSKSFSEKLKYNKILRPYTLTTKFLRFNRKMSFETILIMIDALGLYPLYLEELLQMGMTLESTFFDHSEKTKIIALGSSLNSGFKEKGYVILELIKKVHGDPKSMLSRAQTIRELSMTWRTGINPSEYQYAVTPQEDFVR